MSSRGGTAIAASLDLLPAPSSAGLARRFVARTLRDWGYGEDAVGVAMLLVSELVTNAILHAGSDLAVVVGRQGGTARVAVRDASPEAPVRGQIDLTAHSGRGIALVADLAPAWGVDRHDRGKAVWFEVPEIVEQVQPVPAGR